MIPLSQPAAGGLVFMRNRPSGESRRVRFVMRDYAIALYRNVTICARVQVWSTPKSPLPTPLVI